MVGARHDRRGRGGHPSGVTRADLAMSAGLLAEGVLRLSRHEDLSVPIARLAELGFRGPVHRDITEKGKGKHPRGPFDLAFLSDRSDHTRASWPMLWSHDGRLERAMIVEPDSEGHPGEGQRDRAVRMWKGYANRNGERIAGATRLHINTDFRLTSQPLGACLTPVPAIGGRAWTSFQAAVCDDGEQAALWEKTLALRMNSTIGLVGRWYMSNRQQSGRANLTVTTIGNIPVVDCRERSPGQFEQAGQAFDTLSAATLLPASHAHHDPTRQQVDSALLCDVLDLPAELLDSLATLREQWTNEPSVRG